MIFPGGQWHKQLATAIIHRLPTAWLGKGKRLTMVEETKKREEKEDEEEGE